MAVLAILILVVIFQNTEPITTTVLFWDFPMPRIVLLVITLVVGIVLGVLGNRYLRKR